MNNLGGLFDKYSKLIGGFIIQKDKISEVIFSVTKIKIDPKDIKIKKGIILLNTNQSTKALIYINKQKILQILKSNLEDLNVLDIK
ncbi:MAG: hypothetical protein QG665_51 [Patescibacteria group bacterium]|nr:hypothetical protein [Patescibacteria group bacterium]